MHRSDLGKPVANLSEFLPDEAIPPIKMGGGEALASSSGVQVPLESGSMLSKNFDDSMTIMARIRLARIASVNKLQKAIFGTRRVALESKKIAYEPLVLSLLLYGSECWVVYLLQLEVLRTRGFSVRTGPGPPFKGGSRTVWVVPSLKLLPPKKHEASSALP